jgi:hypothetical protein
MEKQTQPQNDIKPEAFLNPENMPPVPASDKEKQKETLFVDLDYQMLLMGILFDKAIRPNMTDAEINYLAFLSVKKEESENNAPKEAIDKNIYREQEEENKKEIPQNTKEDPKISAFSHAVELMQDYLKQHPKVAKLILPGIVAAELAGCASLPYTASSMMQTGIYGAQRVVGEQIYGQHRAMSEAMMGKQRADSNYMATMNRANMNREMAYSRMEGERQQMINYGTPPEQIEQNVDSRFRQIESQYASEINQAKMQYQQDMGYLNQNVTQTQMDTQMQTTQTVMDTGFRVLSQAIQGIQYGGHGYHHMGPSVWNRGGGNWQ